MWAIMFKLSFVSIFSFSIYQSFFQSWSGLAVHKGQKSLDQHLVCYFKEKIKCWCLVGGPPKVETQRMISFLDLDCSKGICVLSH